MELNWGIRKAQTETELKELLHRLNSVEIKLCSEAAKEFTKLLGGDSGGELLRHYVTSSPRCSELIGAWKLRRGKPGIYHVFKLISVVLDHPDGRYRLNVENKIMGISRALDRFARSIFEEHLDDLYKEINGKEIKSRNAAVLLLASIVRRGSVLASDVAKGFDFKLKGFAGLARHKRKRRVEKSSLSLSSRLLSSSRKAFVGFAMSFLEVGKPGLLRWVLQQKEMYLGVLRGLGNDEDGDDDETVAHVLLTLRDRVLVEESLVPPGLRSVLFGSATLERLVEISGRENGGYASELAYDVLVSVCTDPSNGLMPDSTRRPSPLKGNRRRLLGLMKKLRATEVEYHRDLLLAIVCGRPSFGGAYMEEFPYNLEDFASPNWFPIVNLAANLVSSVGKGLNRDSISSQLIESHSPDSDSIESFVKCLFPRTFSQSVITKGLLHSDFLVKHGTLRLLSEALNLLDLLIEALNGRSTSNNYVSLKREIQNEVRMSLPDPQVLVTLLSSLTNQSKTRDVSLKRKADSGNFPERGRDSRKKLKKDNVDDVESDIIIGGVSIYTDSDSTAKADEFDSGKDILNVLREIWGSDFCSTGHPLTMEAEIYFQSKLLDALKTYFKIMPAEFEKLFTFVMKLLNDSLSLPTNLQRSLLSYLMEYVGWSPTRFPINVPSLMYKHLQSFINLMIFSLVSDVKSQAHNLARVAMLSTGAFDRNHHEIVSWFLFLPGYDRSTSVSSCVPGKELSQSSSQVVVSFFCDAVSTAGNSLFKCWDSVKNLSCGFEALKDMSPDFSPLVVCILQKCIRLLNSKSETFGISGKQAISSYVGETLKYILQTQVDPRLLSSVINSILFERLGETNSNVYNFDDPEWKPLKSLLLFSRSLLYQQASLFSIDNSSFDANKATSTPFHVLFPSIMILQSSVSKKIKDALLAKLSDWRFDNCYLSYLRLLLFWIHHIRLSYRVSPSETLQGLSEICFVLLKDLLVQLSDSKTHEIQEVAEAIFSHPVVVTSLSCPLGSENSNLVDDLDSLMNTRKRIHSLDCHVLDLLESTSKFIFSLNDDLYGACKNLVKVFNTLKKRVFEEVKDKFKQGVHLGDLTTLVPPYHTLRALIHFISPFELLELVNWMFKEIEFGESTAEESSKVSALSFGIFIAISAFRNMSSYLNQPLLERRKYDAFWEVEEDKDFNVVEEIYTNVTQLVLRFEIDYADMCLLEAIDISHKRKYMRNHNFHRLSLVMSRIVSKTPVEMISHCIRRPNKTKAKLLFLLTDMSSLHMSIFGDLFLGVMNNMKSDTTTLSDEDFMMLLPSALLYLNSTLTKFGMKYYKQFKIIPSFYSAILLKGFSQWKSFVLSEMFEEEYGNLVPLSSSEIPGIVNDSLLRKALSMLEHHFALDGDSMKTKKRLKIFDSIFRISAMRSELIGCDISAVDSLSLNQSLNLVNRLTAEISFCRMLLFRKQSESKEAETPLETVSTREESSRMHFVKGLADIWQLIVEKFPSVSDVYRFLEDFILRTILELTEEMCGCLVEQEMIPFLEQLVKSALRYRFEDPTTLRTLRGIINTLSEGKFSHDYYLRLLLAHSQFETTIRSVSNPMISSQIGAFSKPMPCVLRYLAFHSTDRNVSNRNSEQLEIIKLFRTLFSFKSDKSAVDFGKSLGINLRKLHLLLLSSYGATLSETDLEIHTLLSMIESIDGIEAENIAGVDYLWGNAASKIEREQVLEHDVEAVKERRRSLFRENLSIDARICTSTVLHFPYDRTSSVSLDKFRSETSCSIHTTSCSSVTDGPERYDPVFLLRFSIYSLSVGYIEPIEFAGLGLLAIAFVSISSPDDGIRKLGYSTLEKFKKALQGKKAKKDAVRIQLLLTSLQNRIDEPWQRIPSVVAIFAAEASFVLLDPSHDLHGTFNRHLRNAMNLKSVPLFNDLFWSNSVNFKAERLWILRLLYGGLNSDEDAQIYIRNSILETLMSFFFSPISDSESNYLILQVVKKSVKSYKLARHLVENCGLLSWLSSVLSNTDKTDSSEERKNLATRLTLVLEVVIGVISFRHVNEWLQKEALEQLAELTSHLYKFLVDDGLVSVKECGKVVDLILEIMVSTLKLSHKRKIYQPHFNISIDGLHRMCNVICVDGNSPNCVGSSELALKSLLMSIPPASIFCLGQEKLQNFVLWAISLASRAESGKLLQNKLSQNSLSVISEGEPHEESLVSKLVRWLTASVILGKLATKPNVSDWKAGLSLKDLSSTFETVGEESTRERVGCEEFLASAILFLQRLIATNYNVLPSVVSALSILLLSREDGLGSSGFQSLLASLRSKIRCPAEANPSWRWTFYQPWKDLSLELTDSEKMDELHACQALLFVALNVLGSTGSQSLLSLTEDVSKFCSLEWEKSLVGECNNEL